MHILLPVLYVIHSIESLFVIVFVRSSAAATTTAAATVSIIKISLWLSCQHSLAANSTGC